MLREKRIQIFVFIFSISAIVMISCSGTKHFELSRFISPSVCGGCHSTIFNQWKNSMHNLSHEDSIYNMAARHFLKGITDKEELAEAEICVKCHTPVGFFSGFPKKLSDDLSKTAEIARSGIQCDFCHSAKGAEKIQNNSMILEPGFGAKDPGVKFGPFKDSKSSYHKSAFSEFHTSSKICGTCHDVKHVSFGTPLESTYEEWLNSPYNSADPAKAVQCQGCHMYQREGVPGTGSTKRPENPGYAALGGPKRNHVFSHYFAGGNSFVPSQNGDDIRKKLTEERLKNAASLSVDVSAAESGDIKVSVKNSGAGHFLPTGITELRMMWIELSIKDASGKEVFSSGRADENGYIPDGSIVYNTVFGDGKGNPVVNPAKARQILRDKRIPPMQTAAEVFKTGKLKPGNYSISVRLQYQIMNQKIMDDIAGRGEIKTPVVTMAEDRKAFKIHL